MASKSVPTLIELGADFVAKTVSSELLKKYDDSNGTNFNLLMMKLISILPQELIIFILLQLDAPELLLVEDVLMNELGNDFSPAQHTTFNILKPHLEEFFDRRWRSLFEELFSLHFERRKSIVSMMNNGFMCYRQLYWNHLVQFHLTMKSSDIQTLSLFPNRLSSQMQQELIKKIAPYVQSISLTSSTRNSNFNNFFQVFHHIHTLTSFNAKNSIISEVCEASRLSLKSVSVYFSRYDDAELETFYTWVDMLQKMPNLMWIRLLCSSLPFNFWTAISKLIFLPQHLQPISHLDHLELTNNGIEDFWGVQLFKTDHESYFCPLSTLDLNDNHIADATCAQIASSFEPLLKEPASHRLRLERFNLSLNQITYRGVQHMSQLIHHLSNLDLSQNPIRDKGAQLLAEILANCKLKVLKLSDCGITVDGAAPLLDSVIKSKTLEVLCLSNNILGCACYPLWKRLFKENCTLQNLAISNTKTAQLSDFIDDLCANNSLSIIDISANRLGMTPSSAEEISRLVKRSHTLSLNIGGNLLNTEAIQAICKAVQSRILRLAEIKLTGNQAEPATVREAMEKLREKCDKVVWDSPHEIPVVDGLEEF